MAHTPPQFALALAFAPLFIGPPLPDPDLALAMALAYIELVSTLLQVLTLKSGPSLRGSLAPSWFYLSTPRGVGVLLVLEFFVSVGYSASDLFVNN